MEATIPRPNWRRPAPHAASDPIPVKVLAGGVQRRTTTQPGPAAGSYSRRQGGTGLEFRLLGPIEVVDGGHLRSISARSSSASLLCLLVLAGQPRGDRPTGSSKSSGATTQPVRNGRPGVAISPAADRPSNRSATAAVQRNVLQPRRRLRAAGRPRLDRSRPLRVRPGRHPPTDPPPRRRRGRRERVPLTRLSPCGVVDPLEEFQLRGVLSSSRSHGSRSCGSRRSNCPASTPTFVLIVTPELDRRAGGAP